MLLGQDEMPLPLGLPVQEDARVQRLRLQIRAAGGTADAPASSPGAGRHEGSSPSPPTSAAHLRAAPGSSGLLIVGVEAKARPIPL